MMTTFHIAPLYLKRQHHHRKRLAKPLVALALHHPPYTLQHVTLQVNQSRQKCGERELLTLFASSTNALKLDVGRVSLTMAVLGTKISGNMRSIALTLEPPVLPPSPSIRPLARPQRLEVTSCLMMLPLKNLG